MRIAVLGAGAWGTALALSASARHEVVLWMRDPLQLRALLHDACNRRYLPDASLPPRLRLTSDHNLAVAHASDGLLVIATPMAALRERLAALPAGLKVAWLCKGFEQGSGLLGHEIAVELRAGAPSCVLSGPSFAQDVARGLPTALVAASADAALAALAVSAFHGDNLRLYASSDPVGVEVGGAVKNVLAIAAGMSDGLGLGLNARAALITRGLAEMVRLGVALGARASTFAGLSGLGDLVLTATGDLSRNRRVGLALATGRRLPDILVDLGHVAEGVLSASTVVERAQRQSVEMPISEAVVSVLEGQLEPKDALRQLLARQSRSEY